MSEERRGSSRVVQTVAFVAVPVIVAVLVAVIAVLMRDDGSGGDGGRRRAEPGAEGFCDQTAPIRRQVEAAVKRFEAQGVETPSPSEVADLIESFDIASLDVDAAPAELQDDLRYVIAHREEAIDKIRAAPVGTPVPELLPADLLDRFATLVQYNIENCAATES